MSGLTLAIPWVSVATLLLVRLAPLTWAMPMFGGGVLPMPARIAVLGVLLSVVLPSVSPLDAGLTLAHWVDALVREALLGGALAIVLAAPWIALTQGGRLLDPLREPPSPVGTLMRWTFVVVFLAAGGLRAVLRAVLASVIHVPPRWSTTAGTGQWLEATLRWSADGLTASVTVVGAALVAVFATEWTLAIAARLSPTLAHSGLARPAHAIVMLGVLAGTVSLWAGNALELAARALAAVHVLVG